MRDEAVKELEAAIKSTKLKLQNKEVELASSHSPDDNDITRVQIAEVKEIIADMEGRVSRLPTTLWPKILVLIRHLACGIE
jgi:HAT1-interacting factor 1